MEPRQVDAPLARSLLRFGVILAVAGSVIAGGRAGAQVSAAVGLGTADNFAVLAGQGVTNTGPTTVNGDLGTSPNPSVTGAGLTVNGSIHAADAVAAQAQADLTVAYNDAEGRSATEVATELGGQILTAGVYDSATGTFEITGPLILDAENDPDAAFIFQTESTLITASASTVQLINGGSACNVFWQVGSSATLGTDSTFLGTILALASVTVTTDVTINGRALARNGAVTLDSDTITRESCSTPTTTDTTLVSSPNPSDSGAPVTLTATVIATDGGTPTGTVTFLENGSVIGSSPVVNGVATLTTTALAPGQHQLTSVYLGAPGFESSTSQELTHLVNAPPQTPPTGGATTSSTAPARTTVTPPSSRGTLPVSGAPGVHRGGALGLGLVAIGAALALGAALRRERSPEARPDRL